MNRKERRAAQKTGATGTTRMAATLASAFRTHQAGHRSEAERLYRDVLAIEPRNAAALHLLGALLHQGGQTDEAISLMRQAIAIEPRNEDYRYNLGLALKEADRVPEAIEQLIQAITLKPQYAEAHFELGNTYARAGQIENAEKSLRRALELQPANAGIMNNLGRVLRAMQRSEDAAALWQRAVTLQPDLTIAHFNIGLVRLEQNRLDDAEQSLRRALVLQPDYPNASHRLAQVLLLQDRGDEALALVTKALDAGETPERRVAFVQSLLATSTFKPDAALRERLRRAVAEAWVQPVALNRVTADVLKAHPVLGPAIQRIADQWASAYASRQTPVISDAEIAWAAGEPLLHTYLESAPNSDVAIERFLTALRAGLLDRVASGGDIPAALLRLYAALAEQCFINEYVFNEFDSETTRLHQLSATVTRGIAAGTAISPAEVLAVAAYRPLHTLENAERLSQRDWPHPVAGVLRQQIREPLRERSLQEALPALTTIDDTPSSTVRDAYEQTPYPRWVRAPSSVAPLTIDEFMQERFPAAYQSTLIPNSSPDIFIAGCGTGLQAIIAAQTYRDANILAVDISAASLAYARRKTEEAGIANIEFAQADILKLASLDRTFDVIESIGVLHHLDDPFLGWSTLLSLLRPGGLMNVGLFSETARAFIVAAQDFAKRGGYQPDPDGIRRCRQDILRLAAGHAAASAADGPDFFTASTFRDLVMHGAEHRMTLPAIAHFLDANDLNFIGFNTDNRILREFARRFPDPEAQRDLSAWHAFELDNPTTFVGMYNFWIQKPA